jgi:hypothetical protein
LLATKLLNKDKRAVCNRIILRIICEKEKKPFATSAAQFFLKHLFLAAAVI